MPGWCRGCLLYTSGNLAPIRESCSAMIKQDALDLVTVDGTVYGLPFNAWYQGVLYNKKIFDTYGLEVPQTLSLIHI